MFDEYLIQEWAQIANYCKQLKSLKVSLISNESLRLNDEILSTLRGPETIGSSFLRFTSDLRNTIKDISDYHELTHLSVKPHYNCFESPFEESILTDIVINYPKLKSLTISPPYTASERTAQSLSQLSDLETLYLNIENKEDYTRN